MAAARARVNEAKTVVASLEDRITPELLDKLPKALANDLYDAEVEADALVSAIDTSPELGAMREAVKALETVAEKLEAAIARAPRLARDFNRLPRAFPKRTGMRAEYHFPDIFSKPQLSLRQSLHEAIDAIDPKARLYDRRTGYFDTQAVPYLVEACFRSGWEPIRLQVSARQLNVQRTTGYHVELVSSYCLITGVRPSTPALELTVDGMKSSMLSMLGFLRDTNIGDSELDESFVVDADAEDAERVLTGPVRAALRRTMRHGEVRVLQIEEGHARLEWQEDVTIKCRYSGDPAHPFTSHAFADAVDVLVGIRQTPPVPLLKRLARRGKRRR